MNAKEMLHKDKDLCTWWAQVVDDPRFWKVMLHAHCGFSPTSMDHLRGAQDYENLIASLPFADDSGSNLLELASPGLHHNIDKPENTS